MNSKDVKSLMEAYASVHEGEKLDEGDLGDRARRVVGDQRGGYHGDADYFKKHQDAIDQRLLQMRPYGVKGFPSAKKDTKKTQVAHFEPEGEQIAEGPEEYAGGQHPSKHPDKTVRDKYETQRRRAEAPKGVGVPDKKTGYGQLQQSADLFDIVKGHLIDEGYADTEEAAVAIMANMSEEWRQSIVEKFPDVKGTLNPWESPKTGKSGVKYVTGPDGKPKQIRNPLYKGV